MSNYASLVDHHSMFFDHLRNDIYAEAIADRIDTKSVVLDIGAGLGINGLMAIESGAKEVYLVEPEPIIDTARAIIKANDLENRVSCIKGKIEDIELPQKVDCIISVFTGNFLLAEDLLPTLFYARDHFLKPGGKLIPDKAVMQIAPISDHDYYEKIITCWSNPPIKTGFEIAREQASNSVHYSYPSERTSSFLAQPIDLMELDFYTATRASCHNTVDIRIERDGYCHGLLGWFKTRVGKNWLSTEPGGKKMLWRQAFLPLHKPVKVFKGEKITVSIDRPEYGNWTWAVKTEKEYQQRSTFNSRVYLPSELAKTSNDYNPELSKEGQITLEVLKDMSNDTRTSLIVQNTFKRHPVFFKTEKRTEIFVKSLVRKYG